MPNTANDQIVHFILSATPHPPPPTHTQLGCVTEQTQLQNYYIELEFIPPSTEYQAAPLVMPPCLPKLSDISSQEGVSGLDILG